MNVPDLTQKRGTERKEFSLGETGVDVCEKNFSTSKKFHVYFENIPPKSQEFTDGPKSLIMGTIVAAVLASICLILALIPSTSVKADAPIFWAVTSLILSAKRKTLLLFVQNGAGLVLFKDKPSLQQVESFVEKLFKQRKIFLLKKYGRFSDEEGFEDKIARLSYLRAQEVISEQEFEAKREEFSAKKPSGSLGFST